jgi:hypothetical protein
MMPARPRQSRLLGWLTLLCVAVGAFSALSYALSAPIALRASHPALGAWWDAYQFYFMAGSATALGLLIGIRGGQRLVNDSYRRRRGLVLALALAVIAFLPLLHLCAAAARLGWSGGGGPTWSRIVDWAGYGSAKQIDKVVIASVYFLKIVGFALPAGLALMGAAAALVPSSSGGAAQQEPAQLGRTGDAR